MNKERNKIMWPFKTNKENQIKEEQCKKKLIDCAGNMSSRLCDIFETPYIRAIQLMRVYKIDEWEDEINEYLKNSAESKAFKTAVVSSYESSLTTEQKFLFILLPEENQLNLAIRYNKEHLVYTIPKFEPFKLDLDIDENMKNYIEENKSDLLLFEP